VPIELIDVCRTFGREVGKIFMGLASKRLREMDKILGWLCSAILCGLILGIASFGYGQQSRPTIGPTEDLPSLLKTLKENVGLYGNIVLSLETQKKISELGKREPKTVVPVIIGELKAPRASNQKALNYRMALISVLEEIGPAAEAAAPVLTEIVQNEKERNDFILLKARMALTAIGTPPARQSAKASEQKNLEQWFQKASAGEIAEAVAQHSYLIRRELRSPRMSEEVIEASVTALLPMGLQAAQAGPTRLRAWQDPRIGENLRSLITRALTAIGVRDIQAAAKRERQQGKVESGYVDEIVSDVQSNTSLVSTMAMQELAARRPNPIAEGEKEPGTSRPHSRRVWFGGWESCPRALALPLGPGCWCKCHPGTGSDRSQRRRGNCRFAANCCRREESLSRACCILPWVAEVPQCHSRIAVGLVGP
jgi:hypothetical protein